jgi:tRNA (mo5U34)-methyltransferase
VKALAEDVQGREWYHTLELAPGVVTPGWFDTRALAETLPWPALTGRRCLDVGTFDGFWAFAMERRGAAEVAAVDVLDPQGWDWPPDTDPATVVEVGRRKGRGEGFEVAARALGSRVRRRERSVYDLDPQVDGLFDVVYVGSLLLHLRDPLRALAAVRSVLSPGGDLLLVDAIDLPLTLSLPRVPVAVLDGVGRPWWWKANLAGLARMVTTSGFELVEPPRRTWMTPGAGQATSRPRPRLLVSRAGRDALVTAWRGDPHGVVRARAVPTSR